jgi:hypothetical protein
MKNMNSNDNQNEFAVIHIRPGTEGKHHPVGTVAINLEAAKQGALQVGYAIQHSKLDKWDAARGRAVAIGRAGRGRDSMLYQSIDPKLKRRELFVSALELITLHENRLDLSRGFRAAIHDTLFRLIASEA